MPMASNLLGSGFELHVYNRTRSRTQRLVSCGAKLANSPSELAGRVDIVLTCLADVAATDEVFGGVNGLIEAARPGQILVDHSTVDLLTSRRLHADAARRGAHFLDAPISGGPEGAEAASLAIMVGGEVAAFEAALPVFEAIGKRIRHMGGPGAGTVTKLANQILVSVHTLAASEAMLLASRAGVDIAKLAEVLSGAWGASRMLERNAPVVEERRFGPSAAPLRNFVKDLDIIVQLGRTMGVDLPATRQAQKIMQAAAPAGMSDADIAAVFELLERQSPRPE